METKIFVLDYNFSNPLAMDRALEIVEEFIDQNKDGSLDYTIKEIICAIDENFYKRLTRGDKCRVGSGISSLYNKGQIFYIDRGSMKGVTNTYHVNKHWWSADVPNGTSAFFSQKTLFER